MAWVIAEEHYRLRRVYDDLGVMAPRLEQAASDQPP